MKKSNFVIILAIVGILAFGYILFGKSSKTEIIFPIDNEKEAVSYAKTDSDIQEFPKIWGKTETRVNFDKDNNVWSVLFIATEVTDVCLKIDFLSNGTVINKYDPCEA